MLGKEAHWREPFYKYEEQQPFNTSHTLFINLIENKFGDTFGDIYKAYNMYFYLIQYVRCYVLFLLSHHLNQNVTENTSLKASLGLHQGCFPRRPMHLNSMLLSLSQGIKTTITVSDKSSRGLRSISIIHGS